MSFLEPDRQPLSRRHLDSLLGRWAAARRLDPQQAQVVRQRVVEEPADLDFAWWWQLLDPANGSVFQAAPMPATPAEPFPRSVVAPADPFSLPFAPGGQEVLTWPYDDGEYQPYLRLT